MSADSEAANVTEGPISMTVVLIKDDNGKCKAVQYYLLATMLPPLLSANATYVYAVIINLCVNAYCLSPRVEILAQTFEMTILHS